MRNKGQLKILIKRLKSIKQECFSKFAQGLIPDKLTNKIMAAKLEVSEYTLYRWFRGELRVPNQATLKMIKAFIEGYDEAKENDTILYFIES